jgi:signal peptidase I
MSGSDPGRSGRLADSAGKSRSRRWVAGLLSLLLPGLGQIETGRLGRGVAWYLSIQVTMLAAALFSLLVFSWGPLGIVLPILLVSLARILVIVDAARLAKSSEALHLAWPKRLALYLALVLISESLPPPVLPVVKTFMGLYTVPTTSMIPTIEPGDRVVCNNFVYRWRQPKRGEVIAFWTPGDNSVLQVKRIAGLPGERVQMEGQTVLIDGKPLSECCAYFSGPSNLPSFAENQTVTVPAEHYYLLGDNRNDAADSRFFGPIAAEQVHGRILGIYWSVDETGEIRWERIGLGLQH